MTSRMTAIVRRITTSSTAERNHAPRSRPGSTPGSSRQSVPQSAWRRYQATAITSPHSNSGRIAPVDSRAGSTAAKITTAMEATPLIAVLATPTSTPARASQSQAVRVSSPAATPMACPLRGLHHEHGHAGLQDDRLRDAAEQCLAHRRAASCAEDEQVWTEPVGELHDRVTDVPAHRLQVQLPA